MKPGGGPFSIKNFLLFETNITAHLYLAAHPLYTMSYRQYILGKVTVMIFLQILWNDILPLIVFLAAGWFMDSKFKLDLNTYAKLVTRVVLPAFIFYSMYLYRPDAATAILLPAGIALLLADSAAAYLIAKALGFTGDEKNTFRALSTLSNAGQIGIALILMIFSHPPYASDGAAPYLDEARGAIVLLLILMNIAINTVGASLLGAKGNSLSSTVKFIISMPAVYAIFAAAAVRMGGIALEQTFLWPVLSHFTGAFIILTTITAGAQLHRTPIGRPDLFTIGTSINKLFLSPLIAFAIIMLAGVFTPVTAQVFFIYAAVPSSFRLSFCRRLQLLSPQSGQIHPVQLRFRPCNAHMRYPAGAVFISCRSLIWHFCKSSPTISCPF